MNSNLPTLCHVPEDSNCHCRKWVSVNQCPNDGRNKELLYVTSLKRSTTLLEKLTVPQLVKKFQEFYVKRKFIAAFISTRHLSLSWTRTSQSSPPPLHPTSWRSILIVAFHRRLSLSYIYIYIYIYICVCVCVCNRTFPSRLCSRPVMISVQMECCKHVNMSAVDVISFLIPQVIVNSSQPQRDFLFQRYHFAISDILKIEGF
jgi:hypothetical protein